MSHSQETAEPRRAYGDDAGTSTDPAHDWDAVTDVMPPEYSRQLLEISRRLRHAK
jgi:hypothetical protein